MNVWSLYNIFLNCHGHYKHLWIYVTYVFWYFRCIDDNIFVILSIKKETFVPFFDFGVSSNELHSYFLSHLYMCVEDHHLSIRMNQLLTDNSQSKLGECVYIYKGSTMNTLSSPHKPISSPKDKLDSIWPAFDVCLCG